MAFMLQATAPTPPAPAVLACGARLGGLGFSRTAVGAVAVVVVGTTAGGFNPPTTAAGGSGLVLLVLLAVGAVSSLSSEAMGTLVLVGGGVSSASSLPGLAAGPSLTPLWALVSTLAGRVGKHSARLRP